MYVWHTVKIDQYIEIVFNIENKTLSVKKENVLCGNSTNVNVSHII
jgi:hypothetical protein